MHINYKIIPLSNILLLAVILLVALKTSLFAQIVSEERHISDYDKVIVNGAFKVVWKYGTKATAYLEASETELQYINTRVNSRRLTVSASRKTATLKNAIITITSPSLNSILLIGQGSFEALDTIATENLSVSVTGSGAIRLPVKAQKINTTVVGSGTIGLKGKSQELKASVAGVGKIYAYYMDCEYLESNIGGNGLIDAYVTERADIVIVGDGTVYLGGEPKTINKEIFGSGAIIQDERANDNE